MNLLWCCCFCFRFVGWFHWIHINLIDAVCNVWHICVTKLRIKFFWIIDECQWRGILKIGIHSTFISFLNSVTWMVEQNDSDNDTELFSSQSKTDTISFELFYWQHNSWKKHTINMKKIGNGDSMEIWPQILENPMFSVDLVFAFHHFWITFEINPIK